MVKVAIVTGGNKGIGLATVEGLKKVFDGDVFLTARNVERGMQAAKEVNEKVKEGNLVQFHQLDIDDEESVKTLALFMKEKYGGIDVLINNAAIAFKQAATESFAHQAQVTVATNYFSVKKTCDILFPLLRSGARVVNVSSAAGFLLNIKDEKLKSKFASEKLTVPELDDLMNDFVKSANDGSHEGKGWPNSTYVVSKVGLSALSRIQQHEMDSDSSRQDVVVNHIHPGYVDTDMTSHKGPLTIEEGAKASLFAATLPANTKIKGQYIWFDCTIVDWVNGPRPASWT